MPLVSWVRTLTIWQRITFALVIVTASNLLLQYAIGSTRVASHTATFVLSVLLFVLSRSRALLWRLRNRLLVTYFLFGVVPLCLVVVMVLSSASTLFGQLAADRVREGLNRRIDAVHAAANHLAMAASYGQSTETAVLARLPNELQRRVPHLSAIVAVGDKVLSIPDNADLEALPSRGATNQRPRSRRRASHAAALGW
ncbi:MAG: hypothetical protein GEU99_00685 [Luteitalea sp.]|nr:hypothetical protein [Luteitalea sp.]